MKEYKIQMRWENRFGGEWVQSRGVYGQTWAGHVISSFETAEKSLERLKEHWAKDGKDKQQPDAFRIVQRDVGEWTDI